MKEGGLKQRIRMLKWAVKNAFLRLLISTPGAARIASFGDESLIGEKRAVMSGRLVFNREFMASAGSSYSIRRDIHRLEKGLSYAERKPDFGSLYLGRLVNKLIYRDLANPTYRDSNEFKWAVSVTQRYFEEVILTKPALISVRERFQAHFEKKPVPASGFEQYPKPSGSRPTTDVSFDQFMVLCERRRSARTFLDQPVEMEVFEKAVEAALQSPSACNRQPFHFYTLSEKSICRSALELFPGAKGFFDPLPMMVVVVGDLSAYQYDKDRHIIYTDSGLATMSLILALETLGLSSCCINWPDLPKLNRQIAELLGLGEHQRVIMGVAVGYPDDAGMIPSSTKHAAHEVIRAVS